MTLGMNWKLIDNWISVIKYGWSIRFNVLAAVSAGASAMLPFVTQGGTAFAVLSAILAGCAALFAGLSAFSRVIHQANVHVVEDVK